MRFLALSGILGVCVPALELICMHMSIYIHVYVYMFVCVHKYMCVCGPGLLL